MNKSELAERVKEWAKTHLGESFQFREYQIPTIINIIENALNGVKTQVGELPCGSGKSIIALIVCGVLWEYYGKQSYILVSDLSLFEQYEADLKKYKLDWGHIKGKDNYLCARNGHSMSNSECSLNMVPTPLLFDDKEALKKGYPCAHGCKYVQIRKQAQKAPITIMTYSFWLIARNYIADQVMDNPEDAPFKERDFIICDEAHKLPDIVQSHFAPRIDTDDMSYLYTLKEYGDAHHIDLPSIESMKQTAHILHLVEKPEDVLMCAKRYESQLDKYTNLAYELREKAKGKEDKSPYLKYLKAGLIARDCHCKFADFIPMIDEFGIETLIKTSSEKDGETHITLNCAYENQMVNKYFHEKAPKEFLMSATIGDCDIYRDMIGEKDIAPHLFSAFQVPSTFDFSKSPIYFDNRYRLSMTEKAKNIPYVVQNVIDICRKHTNERGLIQVSSYELSDAIYKALPADVKKRVIFYNNSKEKIDAIERYEASKNKILIGASLWEGLNFPNDKARFLIIAKVPYANLGDKLVKAKLDLIPGWYQNDVCNKITQGIGRIVRTPTDWGVTYILDGCFTDVMKRCDLPKEVLDRIQPF